MERAKYVAPGGHSTVGLGSDPPGCYAALILTSFQVAYHRAGPHGVVCAVHIPDRPDPVPDDILARLHPLEAAHARTLRGYRQVQFVGGRIALREAVGQVGVRVDALMSDERGAPALPAGVVGSVSHKRDLAIAMVARDHGWRVGVDLEDYGPPRLRIAEHILRAEELAAIAPLPETDRWIALLLRFSIKESIYKALDPYVHRYVGFHEASVDLGLQGDAAVTLHLKGQDEGPFDVEALYHWWWGRVVTSVRIRPSQTPAG